MIRFVHDLFCKIFMLERMLVEEHQRVLIYKRGQFSGLLQPGTYYFFNGSGNLTYEVFDTNVLEFKSKSADALIKQRPDVIERHFLLVDTTDRQVAIVSVDGKIAKALPPGTRKLFWKETHDVTVERVDISTQYEAPRDLGQALLRLNSDQILFQLVPESHVGLVYLDGKYLKSVSPGMYVFWKASGKIALDIVDTRLQQVEVAGQELLTKDRVTLRLTLTCAYHVTDPLRAKTGVANAADFLYKDIQFGIREAVSAKMLDELLAEKDTLNKTVFDYARGAAANIGIEIDAIGVKDIILPGDMRDMMNQVILAKKLAEANQIKRQEETAATRSLLNTARLMENNPLLLRLKELETIEKLTEKIGAITVYGGFDGLLREFLTLKPPQEPPR